MKYLSPQEKLATMFLICWLVFMLLGSFLGVGGAVMAVMQQSLLPLIPFAICMAIGTAFFIAFMQFRYHPKKLTLQQAMEQLTKK